MFLIKKKVDSRDNSKQFPELIMQIYDEVVLHKKRPLDYSLWNTPLVTPFIKHSEGEL